MITRLDDTCCRFCIMKADAKGAPAVELPQQQLEFDWWPQMLSDRLAVSAQAALSH